MSRNGSPRRFWSGMTALSLLSFLILIIMTANVPVAYGESGMKIVLPSGKTITPSAAPPPASAKGFSAPGASLLSSSDGDPVDTTVGPTTRINQPVFEGDCTTPGGCTQNTPSIAKSNKNAVIGYQSTWGFYQPTPPPGGLVRAIARLPARGHPGVGARPKVPQQACAAARCHRKWMLDSTGPLLHIQACAVESPIRPDDQAGLTRTTWHNAASSTSYGASTKRPSALSNAR